MKLPSHRLSALTLSALGALTLAACENPQDASGGDGDFISDDPTAGDGNGTYGDDGLDSGGEDGGDTSGDGDGDGDGDGEPELEISEADIIQMEGDTLYALSAYSGLTVVDMSNPDDLESLGTWETDAEPFEMYVEAAQAFVMFNDYGFWEWDDAAGYWNYYASSRLVALDASNPDAIAVKGEFKLPGRIQDSRRVGDVLYLVTMQDGYCWDCDVDQKTVITSLDISDEANPVIVDQLSFVAPGDSWDWQRSVESTTQRMYVASNTWSWEGVGSTIEVVDISAGDGTLVPGTTVQVAGTVFSRWQMNEYEGVLRVISQFGWSDDPLIETFTIESSQSIVPLGSGNLSLPMPESLRSARFDGDRAYAITAEQTDPLFTIDLSDPANPLQVGELEIPGWVYHMETRGDRVLALGYDPGNPEGSINVSLFDVSVFDAPALRRRVAFGGDWANFAEDQNQIHKAFSILDDEELLLIPHSGWQYDEGNECYGTYKGGVQLIDWKDDDLTLRGLVPARGQARRAFTHRERLITVSDMELATFDYADRDAPTSADELALAVQVDGLVDAGDVWVRMARDWWTSAQVLEIVSIDDPESAEPLGVIDLGEQANDCSWTWVENLFAVGDHVFVVRSIQTYDDDYNYYNTSEIISVDISNPAAPVIVDVFEVPGQRGWGTGQLANVSTQSSWLAQHGDHVAFLTQEDGAEQSQVHVLDLSDPANIQLAATLERPAGQTQGELSVMSDSIVSWHTEPVEGQPGKVRFYFDRLDLAGEPSWATKINVPGIIVAYDSQAGRAFTIDFDIDEVELEATDCYNHAKFWSFEYDDYDANTGTCKLIHRELDQLDIEGSHASLVDTIDIEGDAGLDQLIASQTRIFAKLDQGSWDNDYDYYGDTELVMVDISTNMAVKHQIDGEEFGDWWWITAVDGNRAVLQQDYGQIGLIDASVILQPEVQESELPSWGGCYAPVIDGDTVLCPMGAYGLETVEW